MQSIILTFIFTSVIIFLIIFVKIKYLEFQLYNTDMDKLEQKYLAIIDKNKSAISIGCAYLDLTTLYIKQGKYEKARACINSSKTIKYSKKLRLLLSIQESTLLIKEQQFDEAEHVIMNCLPNCTSAIDKSLKILLLNNLAIIKLRTNKQNEAFDILNDLVNRYPNNLISILNLADLYYEKQDFANASILYKKVLVKTKDNEVKTKITEKLKKISA